ALLAQRLAALPSNDATLARAIVDARAVVPLAGIDEAGGRSFRGPPFVVVDRWRGAGGRDARAMVRRRARQHRPDRARGRRAWRDLRRPCRQRRATPAARGA